MAGACKCGERYDARGMCPHCDAAAPCCGNTTNRLLPARKPPCAACDARDTYCSCCRKRHETKAAAAYCEKADRAAEIKQQRETT